LAGITHRLQDAAKNGRDGFIDLVEALNDNRRLWTIFASDVADDGNELPEDLRARILYLAEFTFQHTRKVLARRAGVSPLLEINTAILRGLRNGAN
jgi:flagellar protein FlaF